MRKVFAFLLILLPLCTMAQYTITGKVVNIIDKKPIAKASIYLSNTTVGAASADDGSYKLNNVKPGQYQLIVSAVGFETYYLTINANQNITLAPVELLSKSIDLKEVIIKPDADWDRNYNWFKQDFFGPSPFAQQCKILNPEQLDITYNKKNNTLSATSLDYLTIENKALGYRLRYSLNKFIKDFQNGYLYYEGTVLFENLSGSTSQLRRWTKNRREAYFGSSEHYLRSVISNSTNEAGFKTLTLIRRPNPDRPADSIIQAQIKKYRAKYSGQRITLQKNDSLDYWLSKSRLPKIAAYLINKPVVLDSLVKRTDQKGIFALPYKDCLYIVYTKKKGNTTLTDPTLDAPDHPTTILSITDSYMFFDFNGVIVNPAGVMFEGAWGLSRIANLLPVDYEPNGEKTTSH